MSSPNKVENFYGKEAHCLGKNPIFNPFLSVENLPSRQRMFKEFPLSNYGMSYKVEDMTPEERFSSQVRLLLNTVNYLGNVKNKHLLEVGSGTGSGAFIVDSVFKPASISGVDSSPYQTKLAKKLNKGNNRINLHNLNAKDIAGQFGSAQFDGIYSIETAQYMDTATLRSFFKGAFTTLKPEGKLAFCSLFSQGRKHGMHNIEDTKSMLEKIGFQNIEIVSIGKYVFEQLAKWSAQVAPQQTWPQKYLQDFPTLLDYYIVVGRK